MHYVFSFLSAVVCNMFYKLETLQKGKKPNSCFIYMCIKISSTSKSCIAFLLTMALTYTFTENMSCVHVDFFKKCTAINNAI